MAAEPEQKTMAERFVKSEILFKIPFSPKNEMINPINGNKNKLQIAIGPQGPKENLIISSKNSMRQAITQQDIENTLINILLFIYVYLPSHESVYMQDKSK